MSIARFDSAWPSSRNPFGTLEHEQTSQCCQDAKAADSALRVPSCLRSLTWLPDYPSRLSRNGSSYSSDTRNPSPRGPKPRPCPKPSSPAALMLAPAWLHPAHSHTHLPSARSPKPRSLPQVAVRSIPNQGVAARLARSARSNVTSLGPCVRAASAWGSHACISPR